VFGALTRSQGQFVSAKRERFELARARHEPYCITVHEGCVMEFRRYGNFERIKVKWIDYPPPNIMSGWFIFSAWGSLEGVIYRIGKRFMAFERRFTC